MLVKFLLIIIGAYVAFEIFEHLVLPLIWLVSGKKKKSVTGAAALIGEVVEVKEWNISAGRVFVHGEIWWAESDASFMPGAKAVVKNVTGITLKIEPLKK